MRYMKYGELRINLENLLGVYIKREEVGDKYVDDNSKIVIQSLNFDNSISTTKILCKFELGKKIINKVASLLIIFLPSSNLHKIFVVLIELSKLKD